MTNPDPHFWRGKSVLVTGGTGFIGSHIVDQLLALGARVRVSYYRQRDVPQNLTHDRSQIEMVKVDLRLAAPALEACRDMEVVLHTAANVGSVQYNIEHPGSIYRDNILLNTQIMEAARLSQVDRTVIVSSASVYPRICTIPTPESEGFQGEPDPTNQGYAWSKRMAELQAQVYAREFGMKIGVVRPFNAYGPRDHFGESISHVIPALIHRLCHATGPLTVWGSGHQTRAFLYADDFARGVILSAEKYPTPDPINLGTDEEVAIRDVVNILIRLSGKAVEPHFDTSHPDGQPRRNSDNNKAKEKLGFSAQIKLEEGLRKTLTWYQSNILKRVQA